MNFNPGWGGNRDGNRGGNRGSRRQGRGWRGPHRGGPPLFRGGPPGLRGNGHHCNPRGRGYRGPPMDNYKQYPPTELSWTHMRTRPLLPIPPSGSMQRRPFLSPPRCTTSPVRPSSPLPGTEEYMQRNISEKSAFLKRELALESATDFTIDSSKFENFTNDFVSDSTTSNFYDHPFEQQRIASLAEAEVENKPLQQVTTEKVPSPRRSKKPMPRPTQQRVLNVGEIHDRIMNHISNLSLGKKMNLVNQARPTGYDIAIQQITRQKRLQLSKALRDMCNDKFKESDNSSDVINAIIPDFDIKIEELPRELVAQLSTTLNEDVEQRIQNLCIDPEAMFQQAADMLNFSLDGDPFADTKESADSLHDAFNFSTFQNLGDCSDTTPDNSISQTVMEPIANLTPNSSQSLNSCSNLSFEETRSVVPSECQPSPTTFNPLAETNFAIPIFSIASALSQKVDDKLPLQQMESPETNSIFTPTSDEIGSEACAKPGLQYYSPGHESSDSNSVPTNSVLVNSTVSQNVSNDDSSKLPAASDQGLEKCCDSKMEVDHILLPPGEPPPLPLSSESLQENLSDQYIKPSLNMDVQNTTRSEISEKKVVTLSDLHVPPFVSTSKGEDLVQISDVLAEAAELEACLAQSDEQLKLLEMSKPASVSAAANETDNLSKYELIEMDDKKTIAEVAPTVAEPIKKLKSPTSPLRTQIADDKQEECVKAVPIEEPLEKIENKPNENVLLKKQTESEEKTLIATKPIKLTKPVESNVDKSSTKFSEATKEQNKARTDDTGQPQPSGQDTTTPPNIKSDVRKSSNNELEQTKTNKNQENKTKPSSKIEEKNEDKKVEQKQKPPIESEAVENKKGKKSSAKHVDAEDRCSKSRPERSRYDVFQTQKYEEEYRKRHKDRADCDEERYRRFERDRSFDKMHEVYRSPDSDKSENHRYSKYHSEREEVRHSKRYYHEKPYVYRPEYVDFKKDYSYHPQKHSYSPDYHSRQESPYLPEEYEQKSSHHSQHHKSKRGKAHKKRSKKHKRHREMPVSGGSSAASSDMESSVSSHRKSKHRTKYADLPDRPDSSDERAPTKNHKKPLKERIQMLHESKSMSRKRTSSGSGYDENMIIKSEPVSPEVSRAPSPERSKSVGRVIVEKVSELKIEGNRATPALPASNLLIKKSNKSRKIKHRATLDVPLTICPNKTLTEDAAKKGEDVIGNIDKSSVATKNVKLQEKANLVEKQPAKAPPTVDNTANIVSNLPTIVQPKDKPDVAKVIETLPHEICHPMRSWKSPGEKKFMMEHLSRNSAHEEESLEYEPGDRESVKKARLNSPDKCPDLANTNVTSGTKKGAEETPDTLDVDSVLKQINVRKSFLDPNSDLTTATVKSVECKSPILNSAKDAEMNTNCVNSELKTNENNSHLPDVRSKEINSTSLETTTAQPSGCIEHQEKVEQQPSKSIPPIQLEAESNQTQNSRPRSKSTSSISASEGEVLHSAEVSSTSDTAKLAGASKQNKSGLPVVSVPSEEATSLKKEDIIKEALIKPDDVVVGEEKMLVTTYTQTQEEDVEPTEKSSHKKSKKDVKRDNKRSSSPKMSCPKTTSNSYTQAVVAVASNFTQTQNVKCKNVQVQSDWNKKTAHVQTEAVVIIDTSDNMNILDKSENCNKSDRKILKAVYRKRTIQRMFDLDKEIERLTKFRQKLYKQLNFDSDSDDNDLESHISKKDVNNLVVDTHSKHKEKHSEKSSESAKNKTSVVSNRNELKSNVDDNENVHDSHHKRKKLKTTKTIKKAESKSVVEAITKKPNKDKIKTNRNSATTSNKDPADTNKDNINVQPLIVDETHLNRISDVDFDKPETNIIENNKSEENKPKITSVANPNEQEQGANSETEITDRSTRSRHKASRGQSSGRDTSSEQTSMHEHKKQHTRTDKSENSSERESSTEPPPGKTKKNHTSSEQTSTHEHKRQHTKTDKAEYSSEREASTEPPPGKTKKNHTSSEQTSTHEHKRQHTKTDKAENSSEREASTEPPPGKTKKNHTSSEETSMHEHKKQHTRTDKAENSSEREASTEPPPGKTKKNHTSSEETSTHEHKRQHTKTNKAENSSEREGSTEPPPGKTKKNHTSSEQTSTHEHKRQHTKTDKAENSSEREASTEPPPDKTKKNHTSSEQTSMHEHKKQHTRTDKPENSSEREASTEPPPGKTKKNHTSSEETSMHEHKKQHTRTDKPENSGEREASTEPPPDKTKKNHTSSEQTSMHEHKKQHTKTDKPENSSEREASTEPPLGKTKKNHTSSEETSMHEHKKQHTKTDKLENSSEREASAEPPPGKTKKNHTSSEETSMHEHKKQHTRTDKPENSGEREASTEPPPDKTKKNHTSSEQTSMHEHKKQHTKTDKPENSSEREASTEPPPDKTKKNHTSSEQRSMHEHKKQHTRTDKPENSNEREASTEPPPDKTKKKQQRKHDMQYEPHKSDEVKHSKSKKKSKKSSKKHKEQKDHPRSRTKRSLQLNDNDSIKSTESESPPTKLRRKKSESPVSVKSSISSEEPKLIVKTANKALKAEINAITPNTADIEAVVIPKSPKKEKTPVADRETKRRGGPKSKQKRRSCSKELEDKTARDESVKTDLGNENVSDEQDQQKPKQGNSALLGFQRLAKLGQNTKSEAEDIDTANKSNENVNEAVEEPQSQKQRKRKKSRNISESHETDHGTPKKKPKRYPFSGVKSGYKSKRRKSSSSETSQRRKLSTDVEEKAIPAFVGSVVNITRYSLVQLEEMRKSIQNKTLDVPTHAASEECELSENKAAEASNVAELHNSERSNSVTDIRKTPLPVVLIEGTESEAISEEIPIKEDTPENSSSADILPLEKSSETFIDPVKENGKEGVNNDKEIVQEYKNSEDENESTKEHENNDTESVKECESNNRESLQECEKNNQLSEPPNDSTDDVEITNESAFADRECIEVLDEANEYKMDFKGFSGAIIVIKVIASTALAASDKGKLFCFDMLNGELINTFDMSKLAITSMVVTQKDGDNIVYTGSLDSAISVLNFDKKEVVKHEKVTEPVQCMESCWNYIFIGSDRGSLIRYDLNTEKFAEVIKISDFNVLMIKATQEGPRKVLIIATRNAPVSIRDACSGLLLRTMETPFSPTVYTLLFDKNLVYCGTSQHDILVYTFEDGQLIFKHEATKSKGVVCMQIVGNLLFAGCYNGNIYVYNTQTNVHVGTMNGPGGLMLSMEIVRNKIVVGTKSSNFRAWKIPQEYLDQI